MVDQPEFFGTPRPQSIVKTQIVAKYFDAWWKVVLPQARNISGGRIAYIDLFSGPGRYEDGSESTPLWILRTALKSPDVCDRLVTVFNDRNSEYASSLRSEIGTLPNIERLKHKPQVTNYEVGSDLVKILEKQSLVPTLFFVDPWGYKGLSLKLIGTAIRSWGCECIFFFNFNRINPGLNNPAVYERMADIFGADRAASLRERVSGMTPFDREMTIVNDLAQGLQEVGGQFVLPFAFKSERGERTSHHLIFVSKHFRGYHIMKEVMYKLSSGEEGAVKSFEYTPVKDQQLRLLFDLGLEHSIPALKRDILNVFDSRTLSVQQVYERHSVGKPYILRNYKDALKELESEGHVSVDIPAEKRPRRKGEVTLADSRLVTFHEIERTG